jgi:GWxTD domain-containing protein
MKKSLLLIFFSIISQAFGQKTLNFEFDYARFAYDSSSSYVEFYYSFNQEDLTLTKTNSGFLTKAVLSLELEDTLSKKIILSKNWKVENPLKDSADLQNNKSLIGVLSFAVPAGIYKCTVSGRDGYDSTKTQTYVDYLKITPFTGDKISLSDIQISSNIKQEGADSKSIFYKNTLEVVPNPAMLFGQGMPVLFYYLELYNLKSELSNGPLKLKTLIYNSKGIKLSDKNKLILRNNGSRVEVGTINLNKYPTDTYTITLSLVDSSSNYAVASAKRFFVYNPSVKDTFQVVKVRGELLSSQFGILSEDECDQMFEKGKFIASKLEIEQYENLDSLAGKREFLYKFWARRDNIPSTPENEFYKEYMDRVNLCNERYGVINKPGMKTDRGRVYLIYGEPDEIERFPNEISRKPYEIWYYHKVEGGVYFVFGDVTGFSNYELLHSTKRGEMQDDSWERRITTN